MVQHSDGDFGDETKGRVSFSVSERLYSAPEIAEKLGVSERWVRDHATRRNPRIPAIKLGPLIRFRWQDIQSFLAECILKK